MLWLQEKDFELALFYPCSSILRPIGSQQLKIATEPNIELADVGTIGQLHRPQST
jgi:hypothetical protein